MRHYACEREKERERGNFFHVNGETCMPLASASAAAAEAAEAAAAADVRATAATESAAVWIAAAVANAATYCVQLLYVSKFGCFWCTCACVRACIRVCVCMRLDSCALFCGHALNNFCHQKFKWLCLLNSRHPDVPVFVLVLSARVQTCAYVDMQVPPCVSENVCVHE